MRILPGDAGTLKYLGEAKRHSEVQRTFSFKQIFMEIFSVLDSALAKRKIFSLTFQMMHSKQVRARFLSSQHPFLGHRAWKSKIPIFSLSKVCPVVTLVTKFFRGQQLTCWFSLENLLLTVGDRKCWWQCAPHRTHPLKLPSRIQFEGFLLV